MTDPNTNPPLHFRHFKWKPRPLVLGQRCEISGDRKHKSVRRSTRCICKDICYSLLEFQTSALSAMNTVSFLCAGSDSSLFFYHVTSPILRPPQSTW